MKKATLYFLFLLLSISVMQAQTNLNYPSLKEVVEYFDNKYYYKSTGSKWLKLAKTPKGWIVYEQEYDNGKYKQGKEYVFWSSKTGKYEDLQLKFQKAGTRTNALKTAAMYDVYRFERNYYYGYEFDNLDVIKELGGVKKLGDTALEGLARAYSSHSLSFVENVNGFGNNKIQANKKIPEALADSFIVYVDKAIETFGRLMQQAPAYETLVGNISIKYSNEYMYAYLTLAEWGYEKKGRKYLVDGLYGEAFLEIAANYFNSMDDNGIFFSNGDNDTYPLLYLQQKRGIGKNVSVINLSLLGKPRYIDMIRNGYGGNKEIAFTLPADAYKNEKLNYISIDKKGVTGQEAIPTLDAFLKKIAASYKLPDTDFISIAVDFEGLEMPVDADVFRAVNQLSVNDKLDQTISIELNRSLYLNGLAVLDILHSNRWQRNIYIAEGYDDIHLSHYKRSTGVVKKLYPVRNAEIVPTVVDEKVMYKNLMERFTFNPNNFFVGLKGRGFGINVWGVRNAYKVLATQTTDLESKAAIARKGLSIIPNEYTPYDLIVFYLAEQLAVAGEITEAETALRITVNNLLNDYLNPSILQNYHYNQQEEKEELERQLGYALELATMYGMDKLTATIDGIKKRLETK
ncbi:MAG: hypothetical protein F9K23_08745 [Bacteroidetes bacterium]|nr:MAG: hypothetical protein F9K23_08745 [Bacteroidota bacterium]